MKYLSNIDLNSNQLQNSLFHLLASDPGSPTAGQFWYNTTSNKAKYYTGSATITVYDADSANTASKLVLRDGSGNFAANIGTFVSVTLSGTPTADTDAATKAYVDSARTGLDFKASARLATAAALPAYTFSSGVITADSNGALTIDSVASALNDRILVKDESGANEKYNGVWYLSQLGDVSNPYKLTRTTDADSNAEVTGGLFIFIEEGTVNADSGWVLSTNNTITLNTTALTFVQFSSVGNLTFTAPLDKTGSTVSLLLNARLVNNGGNLDLQAGVVSANTYYGAITVDTYGRVTAGADISSSNGLVTKTSAGTFTSRTITGTAAKITVTDGDGVAGNPTLTIASDYVGQASITTLGTITTGVWTGTAIAVANGGTGSTTAAAARTALSAAGLFNGSLTGDGATVAFTITHNLNNRQSIARILDSSYNVVQVDSQNTTVNATVVTFAVAPANALVYYVTVIG